MSAADYYPAGAYNDHNAPYNEVDAPEIEVRCDVSITMSKKETPVFTDNYINNGDEYGDEYEVLDSYSELAERYNDQHYSLTELLEELAKYIKNDLCSPTIPNSRKRQLREMLGDIEGWDVDSVEVDDYEA